MGKSIYPLSIRNEKSRTIFVLTRSQKKGIPTYQIQCFKKNIWLDCLSGYHDHAHCLISLGKDQTISKVSQLLKGESSYWINQNKILQHTFEWQDDYWAVGVSESHVADVRNYIHNQELHHSQSTFREKWMDVEN